MQKKSCLNRLGAVIDVTSASTKCRLEGGEELFFGNFYICILTIIPFVKAIKWVTPRRILFIGTVLARI